MTVIVAAGVATAAHTGNNDDDLQKTSDKKRWK